MMVKYNIAVILTCYNRREKTLSCLSGLYLAQEKCKDADIALSVYLTDDGCIDGTAQAVRSQFSDKDITILQGSGNLYWAGGMRLAWNEALKEDNKWDFYLLLNDDTTPMENMFYELFNAHGFSLKEKGVSGVFETGKDMITLSTESKQTASVLDKAFEKLRIKLTKTVK